MSAKKKHTESYQNPVLKDRLEEFNEKMKKHLSKEMMYLTEKRDDYENQILQLKIEKEQRDKTLFQHVEQKDIRKYFSPLNLSDVEEDKKDEKQKDQWNPGKYRPDRQLHRRDPGADPGNG